MVSLLRREVVNLARRRVVSLVRRQVVNLTVFCKQFTTRHECTPHSEWLCPIFQRYILKAIHNREGLELAELKVVPDISKIHSESNSQLSNRINCVACCCARYFKDTF